MEISQELDSVRSFRHKIIWFLSIALPLVFIVSGYINYELFESYISKQYVERVNLIRKSLMFVWKTNGRESARAYLENIDTSVLPANAVLYYDFKSQRIEFTTRPEWEGLRIENIPNLYIRKDMQNALSMPSDASYVQKHQSVFEIIVVDKQGIFLVDFPNTVVRKGFLFSSFISQVIILLFVLFLLLFPFYYVLKTIFKPFRDQVRNIVVSSKVTQAKIEGRSFVFEHDKWGIFSFVRSLAYDLSDATKHQQWLSGLLDQLSVGMFFTNLKGEVVVTNEKVCELFGIQPELHRESIWIERIHPEDYSRVKQEWKRVIEEKTPLEMRVRTKTPDGLVNWVYMSVEPLKNTSQEVIGLVGTLVPMKQYATETTETSLTDIQAGLFTLDIPQKRVAYSKEWYTLFKYTEDSLDTTYETFCSIIHPEDLEIFNTNIENQQQQGSILHQQIRIKTKDGIWRWVICIARIHPSKRVFGVMIDVTESVDTMVANHQESNEVSDEQAGLIRERKASIVGVIAHQIRTPLTVISQSLDILHNLLCDTSEKEVEEFFCLCKRNTNKIITMLNDTLAYEALNTENANWRFQETSPHSFISHVQQSWQERFHKGAIELVTKAPEGLRPIYIDEHAMTIAFEKLLENALEYTAQGKVEIEVTQDQEKTYITVSDTGKGIAVETIPKLFTLTEVNSAGIKKGVGLSIVQKVVEAHGGEVKCRSEEGKGSTFIITLPNKRT